jgi:PHD/YefM family antitoxin component YafN of YafNO toxin-antitoxin module
VKHFDVLDLAAETRDLVTQCEVTGKQTLFERQGRAVAMLVSYDEYLALRETIDIANDGALRGKLEAAEDEVRRGQVVLVEDLLE